MEGGAMISQTWTLPHHFLEFLKWILRINLLFMHDFKSMQLTQNPLKTYCSSICHFLGATHAFHFHICVWAVT